MITVRSVLMATEVPLGQNPSSSTAERILQTPLTRRDMLRLAVSGAAAAFSSGTGQSSPPEALMQETPHHWAIRSVDMQKETQDTLRNPMPEEYIGEVVSLAKEVNATHIAIGTPYDTPPVPNAVDTIEFTRQWIQEARKQGLNIWHRHMPVNFEGFYDQPEIAKDYKQMIYDYIVQHPDFFQDSDIFAPLPEPQNGGIVGSGCPSPQHPVCQFSSIAEFNQEMQAYVKVTRQAFAEIKKNVKVGYYGFDGFVVAGLDNPGHEGTSELTKQTVDSLDALAVDHSTDEGPQEYAKDYTIIHNLFPTAKIAVGEIGPASKLPDNPPQEEINKAFSETLQEISKLDWIIAVNIYPFLSGKPQESLIEIDETLADHLLSEMKQGQVVDLRSAITINPQYEIVKEYFQRMVA